MLIFLAQLVHIMRQVERHWPNITDDGRRALTMAMRYRMQDCIELGLGEQAKRIVAGVEVPDA